MKPILTFTLLLVATCGFAQNGIIKGTVTDTLNKEDLANAVISILHAKDSVLINFSRTDANGKFEIKQIPPGKHLIMVTYPAYADYVEDLEITENQLLELGKIKMTLKAKLLEDVLVRAKIAAIRLKGDTIEYKADSFKVSPGASVEEMLRKLPGLQVDKDGNITAQGTRVEKVLVDGEEFFGNDPTMATKNLQADAVDKVQVFDKKSDQSEFTGIDDGTKTRTINLTLKEDKKKGYFGKLDLNAGMENRWNNTAMINAFKKKRKLSAYGIMSSTGTTGLSWEDRDKYGGGSNFEFNADEGYFYSFNGGDDFDNGGGNFSGEGIPKSWSTGLNYSNKFNNDKQNVNGSYRYNKLITDGSGNSIIQSILPDTVFFNRESRNFYNSKQRHSYNGTYDVQIDSFTSIKIYSNGYTGLQTSNSNFNATSQNGKGVNINGSLRNIFSDGSNKSINNSILLRRKFGKIGRTISLNFEQQYKSTDTDGFLFSVNSFYDATGGLARTETIDQKKTNYNSVSSYNTRLAYTEPLLKKTFLEISYGVRLTQSEAKKFSYEKSIAGKYDEVNQLFSNHFDFSILTNTTGAMLRYNGKKLTLSGGSDIGFSNFTQTDLIKDTLRKYNFTNLFPRGNFTYKFNANSRVSFNYNGSTRQPTIDQLQPIRDNTNTLNIAVGNPDLRQEFRHSFRINYNFYKVLAQRGLYTYSSFNIIDNAISTAQTTFTSGDSVGQRIFQYINISGNYSGNAGGGYNIKLKKLDMNFNIGSRININHTNSFINGRKNVSDNNSYGINLGLYKHKEKKYNIGLNSGINYNTSVSSIQSAFKTNYYSHNHDIDLNFTLPKKFEFNVEFNGMFRQKINEFDQNNNVILVNAFVGKKIFKNDKGSIRLRVNDLLDQNQGFDRVQTSNMLKENTYQTLRRYFLLSFVWNFSKSPAGITPEN